MQDFDLNRFLLAQENTYATAFGEIRAGGKRSHWIWFIFPQLKGLGFSDMAQYYGITDLAEAKAYLAHPLLRERLLEITRALLALEDDDPTRVMGYPDDLKLRSSMTLFDAADPSLTEFSQVLTKFYRGEKDENTLRLLRSS